MSDKKQVTVNVSSYQLDLIDKLAGEALTSRSALFDLAIRRFVRWANSVDCADLRTILRYESDDSRAIVTRYRSGTMTKPVIDVTGEVTEAEAHKAVKEAFRGRK